MYRPRSPAPATTTILARLSVWAWNGLLRTTGRREPVGRHLTTEPELYGFRKRIRHQYDHCQKSQHQHVHRRPELQIRRLGVLIGRERKRSDAPQRSDSSQPQRVLSETMSCGELRRAISLLPLFEPRHDSHHGFARNCPPLAPVSTRPPMFSQHRNGHYGYGKPSPARSRLAALFRMDGKRDRPSTRPTAWCCDAARLEHANWHETPQICGPATRGLFRPSCVWALKPLSNLRRSIPSPFSVTATHVFTIDESRPLS